MPAQLVPAASPIHQLIVSVPYDVFLEKTTLTTDIDATGDSKGVTVTFYAQFPKDSSQIAATPRCSLVVTWPCYIESVYWFNDTTLEYTYGGQTYYESCFYGSYELMLNPYYTSAATSKAASETRAQTTAKAASEKQAQTTSPSPTPAVPATQSCQVISYKLFCFFDILIRVPYIGPSDCDATFDALKRKAVAGVELSEWACENENGFIRLRFDLSGKSGFVDEILQSRYPSVDGFNCGICSASNAPMSNSSCHQ